MTRNRILLLALCGAMSACNDSSTNPTYPVHKCGDADITSAHCVEIPAGDSTAILTAANSLAPDTTIVLAKGTYAMTNEINIQNVAGVHIIGQGIDETILDWKGTTAQVNGIVAVSANGFLVQDFTVKNSVKDGIRIESSDHITYRRIKATWDNANDTNNGAYGIYPVRSTHVLVENSVAQNASDAGLYVGQCQYVIVRDNEVLGNVAGLEIENCEYADVHGNNAHDNTAGIVVFDLPGNPIIGRDIRIHDNTIKNNNNVNFAKTGTTVASVPVGTGTFAMASRRVEIANNHYEANDTVDIGIVSGLVIQSDQTKWNLVPGSINGSYTDLNLLPGWTKSGSSYTADATMVSNFRSENITISGNSHTGSGTFPDPTNPLQVGLLLGMLYMGSDPMSVMPSRSVDSIVYDTIGETDLTTNDNHICAGGNTMGSFGNLDLASQQTSVLSTGKLAPYARWNTPPFGPSAGQQFDCATPAALSASPIVVWDGN